jgi:dCTP diphosphatase
VNLDLDELTLELRTFAHERDWNQFHTPKNLSMALSGEVGELIAEFQWLTSEQSEPGKLDEQKRLATEDEVADVLIYLV